jgi:hypothetical protein
MSIHTVTVESSGTNTAMPYNEQPSDVTTTLSSKQDETNKDSTTPTTMAAQPPAIKKKTKHPSAFLVLLRSILLDIPLAVLFASFLVIYSVREIHKEYYVPLMDRARRTDEDLHDEFTYYARQCTQYDLSTRNIQELLVNPAAGLRQSVEQMMTHGAMVIPQVLQPDTVQNLRDYIVARNAGVADKEKFPVSQGHDGSRLSYGIDATEHPAVTAAIRQVASNPVVGQILQGLLGDLDPASAEITAITAFAGCEDQSWHQDTKVDGNAIKFARTYSHSYSLFLPLQDTTAAMGATDICPGTHYCTNDLENMCDSTSMGLNEATPEQIFRAGDGALLNQHVWHRGSAHTDPDAPERVVFIMSFLARPSFSKDPRQLSRGTYFHQKWNMWGHTMKDLLDPLASMRKPFSILRCLSLWKPSKYNWGYDLVTSGFMRFVNNQLEDDDLEERFLPQLDRLHFPSWLRGRYLPEEEQSDSWRFFIQETIDKTYAFMERVVIWAHAGYLALVLVVSLMSTLFYRTGTRVLRRTTFRLMLTHGILLGLAFKTLHGIRTSDWGSNVLKGRALMRPFPPVAIAREEAGLVSTGPTTLPQRADVLLGTRYDAEFLGSYDRWLDYHPGNVVFRGLVSEAAPLYPSYKALPTTFTSQLIEEVVASVGETDGRFLQQDYRTGDWRIMSKEVALEATWTALVAASSDITAVVLKSLDHLIADFRFGEFRGTALARTSQLNLWRIKNKLTARSLSKDTLRSAAVVTSLANDPSSASVIRWRTRDVTYTLLSSTATAPARVATHKRFSLPVSTSSNNDIDDNDDTDFVVGSLVECTFEGESVWYPGVIIRSDPEQDTFSVSFHDDTFEEHVEPRRMRKYRAVQQDDAVLSCYEDNDDNEENEDNCYTATVLRVMPDGAVQLVYDEGGELDYRVPSTHYFAQRDWQ